MKYLIDLFVPCGSFFQCNILLTPVSSIMNNFCFCRNHFFDLSFHQIANMLFPLTVTLVEKKIVFITIWVSKE